MRNLFVSIGIYVPLIAVGQTIAVLEHPQCNTDQKRIVRPLFVKTNGEWKNLSSNFPLISENTQWHGVDDSAVVVSIKTDMPRNIPENKWLFKRDYFLIPQSFEVLPHLSNLNKAFSGWCEAPVNRPLLLTSIDAPPPKKIVLKEANLTAQMRGKLLRIMRDSYKGASLCVNTDSDAAPQKTQIRVADIKIETKFQLASDAYLFGVALNRPIFDCNNELGVTESPRWFVISKNSKYLGASMDLIDVLSLNSSQKPWLFFWYSGYNEDGYVLFDTKTTQKYNYTWKYH